MHFIPTSGVVSASILLSSLLLRCNALPTNSSSGAVVDVNIAAVAATVVYYSSTYAATAAKQTTINIPTVVASSIIGPAIQSPATQYLAVPTQALPSLSSSQSTTAVINANLAENFAIWNGSGTIDYTPSTQSGYLRTLNTVPSYSRDSGRGGHIGNTHLFIFADTLTYTAAGSNGLGTFTGAVSNSVAVDTGMRAAQGKPLALLDPIGAYAASNGALRGFVPWTTGEMAYNRENVGKSRWAIWPAQSLITLNPTTALQYSPIVWVNFTSSGATYSQAGVTLCSITIGPGGPVAKRISPRLFGIDDLQWGAIGGIRSYGPSGTSGGNVYILGKLSTGLMLGRVPAGKVANKAAYEYWYPGQGWRDALPTRRSTNTFYNGTFNSVDIFYSPRHLTFIMVYMNDYVDNRLYWRYLNAPQPILPTYAGGNDADIAQYLTQYKWSSERLLMQLPQPRAQFSYNGGAQLGYFGANDISRGGTKMLLTWTEPNGYNPAGAAQGYYFNTAVAEFA